MCGSRRGSICGRRTAAMYKNKNIVNSLAAVIPKNNRIAVGNSKKIVQP